MIKAALTILLELEIERVIGALSLNGLLSPDPFAPFSCTIYGCIPLCSRKSKKF